MPGERVIVLVASCRHRLKDRIVEVIRRHDWLALAGIVDDPAELVQAAISTNPGVVIVLGSPSVEWLELCRFLNLAAPGSRVVVVMEGADSRTIKAAMLAGVRQIVSFEDAGAELPSAIDQLCTMDALKRSEAYLKTIDPHQQSRLIAISGAKGGVGKTTIAANLAVALAQKHVGPVLMWDAYCQFGDIANIMGVRPGKTLTELIRVGDDVDDETIFRYVTSHDSRADILLTSDEPVPMDAMSEGLVQRIVDALRAKYRYIVADTSPIPHPITDHIFSRCWRLLIVTSLRDVTSLNDAVKMTSFLEEQNIREGGIALIASRMARGDAVKEAEAEALVGKKIIGTIPEDPQVAQANNRGIPICQANPRNAASRAIVDLADVLISSASSGTIV